MSVSPSALAALFAASPVKKQFRSRLRVLAPTSTAFKSPNQIPSGNVSPGGGAHPLPSADTPSPFDGIVMGAVGTTSGAVDVVVAGGAVVVVVVVLTALFFLPSPLPHAGNATIATSSTTAHALRTIANCNHAKGRSDSPHQ